MRASRRIELILEHLNVNASSPSTNQVTKTIPTQTPKSFPQINNATAYLEALGFVSLM